MEKSEQFLRLPAVLARVGYSKSRVYGLIAKGEFPKQVAIGQRASAWLASEIDSWIAARINASRGSAQ